LPCIKEEAFTPSSPRHQSTLGIEIQISK
jgi:hypothetical protein